MSDIDENLSLPWLYFVLCKSSGTAESWGLYCLPQLIAKLAEISIYCCKSFPGA